MSVGSSEIVAAVIVLGSLALVFGVRWLLTHRVKHPWALGMTQRCTAPGYVVAGTVSAKLTLSQLPVHDDGGERTTLGAYLLGGNEGWVQHGLLLVLIAAATWFAIGAMFVATGALLRQLEQEHGSGSVRVRKARTQVMLVQRVIAAVAVVIATGAMLFTWQQVRVVGAGLLASAGVVGVIAGIAAQRPLSNLLSGLQLAFSDMLHVDDVLVVEGEWGEVEELTLSYVVIRIWDGRRLVLPVSYFTQQPFQNWTKKDRTILGAVFVRLDWAIRVDELREALHGMLQDHPLWDGQDWGLLVTDVLPYGMLEVRATMSAADGYASWTLNCDVREWLVAYVRDNYPEALPRMRAEVVGASSGHPSTATVVSGRPR